jgi:PAS domain S-box-containing protein
MESEKKYRTLFSSTIEGIALHEIIYNETGKPVNYLITDVNPQFEKILGIKRKKAIGSKGSELYGADEAPYLDVYAKVADTGESASFETYFPPMDMHFKISVFSLGKGKFATVFENITERKKAEGEIKESHLRLLTILDGINALVYVTDMQTYELLFVNKFGRDVWGDITGKICWQTLQEGQKGPCSFCTNKYLVDKKGNPTGPYEWEFQNTVNNRWYFIIDRAIEWLDGRIVRLEIATDITDRKTSQEALRKSEEKFRTLAEKSPNMIFINKRGRVVYANKKCEEIMGYTRAEFYSKDFNFMSLIAPEHLGLVKENLKKHAKGQEIPPYEYALITKGGKRITAIHTTQLIEFEGERAILGIVTDITERKENEDKLKALLDISGDITKTIDLKKLLKTASKKITESTDIDRVSIALQQQGKWTISAHYSRIEGKPTFAVKKINLDDFPSMLKAVEDRKTVYVKDSQDPKTQNPIEISTAKKLKIRSELHIPLISRGEEVRKFDKREIEYYGTMANQLAVMIDNAELFTEIKGFSKTLEKRVYDRTKELNLARESLINMLEDITNVNRALEQANINLKEAEQLKTIFLASMSHELRTPLNSIIGFTGILLQGMAGELNPEQHKQLDIVYSNAKFLLSLIQDLLDISKIETGKMEISLETFSIEQLLDDVVSSLNTESERKGLKVEKSIKDGGRSS